MLSDQHSGCGKAVLPLLGSLVYVHLRSQDSKLLLHSSIPCSPSCQTLYPTGITDSSAPRCLLTGNDSTDLCVVLHHQGDEQTSSKLTAWYPNSEESHKGTPGKSRLTCNMLWHPLFIYSIPGP
jgi:hypothetical protein